INENCGSTDVRALSEAVRSSGADIGIALDGDADRCLLVSEKGDLIDGDEMLSMFAEDMSKRKVLKTPLVVATTMSNLGLEKYLQGLGVSLARTGVGDRYVVEEMRSKGTNLGGEQSGHIIFLDQNTTGDGLLTALQALAITIRSGRTLSELVSKFQRFPQVLVNLDVTERKPFAELGKFSEELRKIEGELAKTGRIIVRYSGTELKARIMIEGEDQATIEKFADSLASLLHVELGSSSVDN
ncbi:phosphoglucosamine mutase, partial [Myxococcota bacterium]|nr:phosphoglucosamine mutase [Myxococcota bacterium]